MVDSTSILKDSRHPSHTHLGHPQTHRFTIDITYKVLHKSWPVGIGQKYKTTSTCRLSNIVHSYLQLPGAAK